MNQDTGAGGLMKAHQQLRIAKPSRAFLDVRGCAELLGLTEKSIRHLVAKRAIPFRRPPGLNRVLFSIPDIETWTRQGEHVLPDEIEESMS